MSNKLMTSLTRPIEKNFLVCPVFAGIDYRGGGDNVGEGGNDVMLEKVVMMLEKVQMTMMLWCGGPS